LKDIVAKTIEPYDIEISNNPAQEEELPYTVQYNETNYNFLRRLSSRYGEWFYYEGEKLVFGKIEKKKAETLTLGYDVNDYHFRLHLEHLNFSYADHNYLDYGNTKTEVYNATDDSLHNLTDIAYDSSKELYEKETFQHLRDSAPEAGFEETEFSAKVQGLGMKAQMLTCYGNSIRADLKVGSMITIEEEYQKEKGGKSKCEHDELMVCKLIHTSDGVSNYENQFMAIPAGCEFPPYPCGECYPKAESQRAVVIDNKDPEKLGRVRVQFLWQKEQDEEMITPWIRIAQPYGGEDKGFYFIPEINEEVMIGFENGNAEKPYVVGTLWHGEQKPREKAFTETNNYKSILSRNKHQITFFDDHEGKGYITIKDCAGNLIAINADDNIIEIYSQGNIKLLADNDIIMEAGNNFTMKAGADISLNAGANIDETAGKNVIIGSGENMAINAGNNMDTNVGNNDTLYVSSNQTIEIGANKEESIADKYQLTAETIREEATDMLQLYGDQIEQRAGSTLKFDGGNTLDLFAQNIRMN
jgi:Rhs element Vgr protein